MINLTLQKEKATLFRSLHHHGKTLILPNVWNALGAALIENSGFSAVATSSSAIALTHGYHDGQQIGFEEHLKQLQHIAEATTLPVSADIENGYAENENELCNNIRRLIDAGIVGINYEDSDRANNRLISIEKQSDRIRIIKETALEMGVPIFINARIDTYVHGENLSESEKLEETLKRGNAYKEAGADGIFPIIIKDIHHIRTLIQEISLPLNVMAFPPAPDMKVLAETGVSRISMGSSFLKIAIQAMKNFADKSLVLEGSEEIKTNSIQSDFLDNLIRRG